MSNCTSLTQTPQISSCQSNATSPFCWPPNGTRICLPTSTNITVLWPKTYYPDNALLALTYNLARTVLPTDPNTGTTTFDLTKAIYTDFALNVPGTTNERSIVLYMRSRVYGSSEVINHAGPTLILVKTGELPSPTPRPKTSYDSGSSDDDVDVLTGLTDAGIAGVIVGVIAGIVLLIALCCWRGWCCCGKKGDKERRRDMVGKMMRREEQEERVRGGVELMAGRGEVAKGGSQRGMEEEAKIGSRTRTLDPRRGSTEEESSEDDEIRVVRMELEAQVVRDYTEPPPKYVP